MSKLIFALLAGSFLVLSGASLSLAEPAGNSDGSQTCNASGPSGDSVAGVCANDMKTNEDMCDGGLSTEPGGGITCAESRAKNPKLQKLNRMKTKSAAARPRLKN